MKTVYIVTGGEGAYSGRSWWVVRAFEAKEDAEAFATLLNQTWSALRRLVTDEDRANDVADWHRYRAINPLYAWPAGNGASSASKRRIAAMKLLDPNLCSDGDPDWTVEEVPWGPLQPPLPSLPSSHPMGGEEER